MVNSELQWTEFHLTPTGPTCNAGLEAGVGAKLQHSRQKCGLAALKKGSQKQ